jgi:hypothetical protein
MTATRLIPSASWNLKTENAGEKRNILPTRSTRHRGEPNGSSKLGIRSKLAPLNDFQRGCGKLLSLHLCRSRRSHWPRDLRPCAAILPDALRFRRGMPRPMNRAMICHASLPLHKLGIPKYRRHHRSIVSAFQFLLSSFLRSSHLFP